jgi:RNA polymerase sigma factor (sigma-70 family)
MSQTLDLVRDRIVELLPRFRRFARTLTRNPADADDLVQISVERALLRYEQWRPETRLESWMFGIIRNAWIDEIRSRQRRSELFAPEESGEHVGDRSAEVQLDHLAVQAALARLNPEQREVVGLVLVEGLSYKEAAEILEIPIGTLTSRLARGRDALQAELSGSGDKAT